MSQPVGRPFIVDPAVKPNALAQWWKGRDRGLSSEAIALWFTYGDGTTAHPIDPSDFGRCERLMRAVPEVREWFPAMANVSPQWARLVEQWDDIVATAEEEVPGVFDGGRVYGSAPRAYAMIRAAVDHRAA